MQNSYQYMRLFHISPIFITLVLISIFLFCSICQFFCPICFYIAVCHTITLHTASKLNYRHNKQNYYGFVIKKHSEVIHVRQQLSKIIGSV